MHTQTRRPGSPVRATLGLVGLLVIGACSPDQIIGNHALPPDVADPVQTHTPDGALAAYRGAGVQFSEAFGYQFMSSASLLTDELERANLGLVGSGGDAVDARLMPEGQASDAGNAYGQLQRARGQISQAMGALRAYAPDAPVALQGQLYTLEGYSEVFLADLFCSGVPLSTLDFNGDFTYKPGSTTQAVYEQAIAHFDSALALAADSADVMNLARVGKGRALLALGDYSGAAQAVSDVPTAFAYRITYPPNKFPYSNVALWGWGSAGGPNATMTDREGGNGLPYLSSHDPRTPAVYVGKNNHGLPIYRPAAYAANGGSPIVLASGVEARLIEAEAALNAGDASWLATLNALRTDGTYTTQPDPTDSTKTDTLWNAGTGGVAGLAPLQDPGTADGRVDLIFQERGYWLFLTGHRQGDLRRLVREYNRDPETVYPTGSYAGLTGRYGSDVNAPVPPDEQQDNPLFHGCFNRGA